MSTKHTHSLTQNYYAYIDIPGNLTVVITAPALQIYIWNN